MKWSGIQTGGQERGAARGVAGAAALLLLMVLAGCSGNGNGTGGGGGGSSAVAVAVSPTSGTLQLNQTIQFSALVANAPNLTIASSNGAVRASGVVTITLTSQHSFVAGQVVTVSGVTDTSFLGNFSIVSVPSNTTFTYNQSGADAASGGGTVPNTAVTWQVNNTTGGSAAAGTISASGLYTAPSILPPVTTATIATNGAVRASSSVTVTTTAAHGFTAGQAVIISGVAAPASQTATITATGAARTNNVVTITTTAAHNFVIGQIVTVSGVSDASFNGTFAVTSTPSATTFTYVQSAANATGGNGSITSTPTPFNGTFVIATVPSTTTFTFAQNGANATSGGGTVSSSAVQIKAISVADNTKNGTASIGLDSGITVSVAPLTATIGTGQNIQFQAAITGTSNLTLNLAVNSVSGGNATLGTVASSACPPGTAANVSCFTYTAPGTAPTPSTVGITAASQADPFKSGAASVGVLAFTAATLTAIYPATGAQGALLEDIYLTGTNFLSTTVARFNGVAVPQEFTTPTLLRVRVSANLLSAAGVFPVDVLDQGGNPTAPINFTVSPVRPALIGASTDSVAQGGAISVNLHGGFYGSAASPAVQGEFNGNVQAAGITDSRTLDLGFNAPAVPGLYSVGVRNPAAAVPLATTNLAVQPTVGPSVLATIPVGATPAAIAVNAATGVAVVANRGDNTISLIDLATNTVTNTVPVGTAPMGVAVDSERNVAVVVNNGSNNISIVNLATASVVATLASPTTPGAAGSCQAAGPNPVTDPAIANQTVRAVGVNPLTGLALVANACSNTATVVDLSTNTLAGTVTGTGAGLGIGTGANTAVAVEPRLDWAILTPGGSGSVAFVDLTRRSVVANVALPTTFRGIAINSESGRALFTDPTSPNAQLFSLQDQTVTFIGLVSLPAAGTRMVAAALNPFTNVGVVVTDSANAATVLDLGTPTNPSPVTVTTGTTPAAVAVDPGSNTALVANAGSNNVTVLGLGAIRPLHLSQVAAPLGAGPAPGAAFTSPGSLSISVTGFGFTGGATVRLDETAIATTFVSSRRLTATIPAAMLGAPRRFAVEVLDGANRSNVTDFAVIQPVPLTGGGAGCASGPQPRAVAIDGPRDFAIVAKACANEVDIIDMNTGTVLRTVTVGARPEGVAVISRLGRALVTNRGNSTAADTVSLVDTVAGTVTGSVTVGDEPIGIAVNEDTGVAVVANANSNGVSIFDGIAGGAVTPFTTNQRPLSVAIDPGRNYAAIAVAAGNQVTFLDLGATTGNVTLLGSSIGITLPTGVVFDPVADRFLAISSLQNLLYIINPDTRLAIPARMGINPTSLAANYNSSTLATVNTASNSLSVMDYQDTAGSAPTGSRRVRAILSLPVLSPGSNLLHAIAIHPRTNMAAIVDESNNRLLLFPLPR